MTKVYFTPNEKRSPVPNLLVSYGIPNEEYMLQISNSQPDYFVGEITSTGEYIGIPIERKSIGDFFGSKKSGHLDNQLTALSELFPFSYLAIIGSPSLALLEGGMTRDQFYSSLVGSSLKRAIKENGESGGVIVTWNLETDSDFVLCLKHLSEKLEKNDLVRLPSLPKHSRNPDDLMKIVMTSFPGVGTKTASKILSHFGSLKESLLFLATGSKEDFQKIFGNRRGENIWTLVQMKYVEKIDENQIR